MKPENEKQLALNLLSHRAKGYSIPYILKKSKSQYIILLFLLGLCLIASFFGVNQGIKLTFLFLSGLLSGAILRDIGWLRQIKQLWPFSFKVYDWEKIEKIAEINQKTSNQEDSGNGVPPSQI